ncbi:MAG: YdcF family protein [Clostridiales bacterium]|nr:YdcF family protein [Clostridiales bacterium]
MCYLYFVLAVVSLLYYITIVVYVDFSVSFSWVWLGSALFFGSLFAVCWMEKRGKIEVPGGLRIVSRLFLLVCAIIFVFAESLILSQSFVKPPKQADYLLVLGAKVKGTKPSNMLRYRLESALCYLKENPDTVVIVSGGQGSDEAISEAQCMADYLCEHGISYDRIRLEDQSVSTAQNLANAKAYLDSFDSRVVIVSNDFHIYRSLKLAKKEGYQNVSGLAAKSNPVLVPHYYMREFFAVVKITIQP